MAPDATEDVSPNALPSDGGAVDPGVAAPTEAEELAYLEEQGLGEGFTPGAPA